MVNASGKKKQKQLGRLIDAATRLEQAGQPQQAVETAVRALAVDADCLPAYRLIARIQLQHHNPEPARWAIGEALRLAPGQAAVLHDSAMIHRLSGDLDIALAHAERALALDPGIGNLHGFIIHLLTLLRQDTAARERLEAALKARPEDVGVGLVFGDWAVRMGRVPEAIARLEGHQRALPARSGPRRDVLFRLGALYEHAGDYDRAFEAIREAQQVLPQPWNPDAYDQAVAEVCNRWTPGFLAGAPRSRIDGSRYVFIVGMPRSGTTLVEQILGAHPQVAAGGELMHLGHLAREADADPTVVIPFQHHPHALTRELVTRIGEGYVAATATAAGDKARLTDKMPANHLHLGLIELALPGARIVHCRRDPRDTGLSCYMTPLGLLPFTRDLRHIGRYARAEQRLMAHWKSSLQSAVLTVDYEDMVANPESGARRLVEFSGLDWHPDCLRFHESKRFVGTASAMQVRQPVYRSSIGRWRHYEKHLGPLLEVLGEQAVPVLTS